MMGLKALRASAKGQCGVKVERIRGVAGKSKRKITAEKLSVLSPCHYFSILFLSFFHSFTRSASFPLHVISVGR